VVRIDGSIATDPNNGLTPCQLFSSLPLTLRSRQRLQNIYFLIGVCQASITNAGDAVQLYARYDFKENNRGKAYA
jgi:hypothetical protein